MPVGVRVPDMILEWLFAGKVEQPQTAVSSLWSSSVWRTDGCVGITGCQCIHHQCRKLWFEQQQKQRICNLWISARLKGRLQSITFNHRDT